jgi:hypothetical protein
MAEKEAFIILLLIVNVKSSGFSENTGYSIGYGLIGSSSVLITFGLVFMLFSSKNKGVLSTLLNFITFLQLIRYTILLNFNVSIFYSSIWKAFNIFEYSLSTSSCGKKIELFSIIGYNSSNFICNGLIQISLVSMSLILWGTAMCIYPRLKNNRWKDLGIFIVYSSVTDISISGYLQLYYV